jgi:hypothetical protein
MTKSREKENLENEIKSASNELKKIPQKDISNYAPLYNSKKMLKIIYKNIDNEKSLKRHKEKLNVGLLAAKSLDFDDFYQKYSDSLHRVWRAFLNFIGKKYQTPTADKQTVYNFYISQNYPKNRILDHMSGIDFNYPINNGFQFHQKEYITQWRANSMPQGDYYADDNSLPNDLGIHDHQENLSGKVEKREQCIFEIKKDLIVLKTVARAAFDTWSIKGKIFKTSGGSYQYFNSVDKNYLKQTHPHP